MNNYIHLCVIMIESEFLKLIVWKYIYIYYVCFESIYIYNKFQARSTNIMAQIMFIDYPNCTSLI